MYAYYIDEIQFQKLNLPNSTYLPHWQIRRRIQLFDDSGSWSRSEFLMNYSLKFYSWKKIQILASLKVF